VLWHHWTVRYSHKSPLRPTLRDSVHRIYGVERMPAHNPGDRGRRHRCLQEQTPQRNEVRVMRFGVGMIW